MSNLDFRPDDPYRKFVYILQEIFSSIQTLYRQIIQLVRTFYLSLPEKRTVIQTKFEKMASNDFFVLFVILLSYLILISPDLLPTIHSVLPNDEAKYIDSGRSLVDLQLRQLSWGPLIAFFYAPLHLLFRSSLDWFLTEAWVGRILMVAVLWFSSLYLASKLKKHVSLFVVVGVMSASVGFLFVIHNPSDVFFSSFSAIALAQLISFRESRRINDITIGSAALGLAALSRIDTLAWLVLYLCISLVISFRKRSFIRILAASLIPALALIMVFVVVSRIYTGGFENSIGSLAPKLYDAFEQNQSVLTGGNDDLGYAQARDIFGTSDENKSSVFRAIRKNPSEFWLRILTSIRKVPGLYFDAFDKRVGFAILLFSCLGAIALVRKRAYSLLLISLLWTLISSIYLGFTIRHLVSTIAYIPIIFASIGITYAFRKEATRSELTIYMFLNLLLIAYSWIDDKPAFLATGVVLMLILAIVWILWSRTSFIHDRMLVAFFLLLLGALILREGFAFPNIRKLGSSPEEHAIHFLQNSLPSGSKVAVPTPNLAVAAVMEPFPIREIPPFPTSESLYSWLLDKGVIAVYVHNAYLGSDSEIQTMLQEDLDGYFNLGYSEGNSIIFVIRNVNVGN